MKNQLKRRAVILLVALLIVVGISAFLNRASFDPNFSVADAISSPTKYFEHDSSDTGEVTTWSYSVEDLALSNEGAYTEEIVEIGNATYVLLQKADLSEGKITILSDKNNQDYAAAVQEVADYYEALGCKVDVREYSQTMMLSLAHAEHFDLFLLREEAET